MEVSGQLHTPGHFTPGEGALYLLDIKLCGPQSQHGGDDEEKITSLPLQELDLISPARSLVKLPNEITKLQKCCIITKFLIK
jgi:hypothetical protein